MSSIQRVGLWASIACALAGAGWTAQAHAQSQLSVGARAQLDTTGHEAQAAGDATSASSPAPYERARLGVSLGAKLSAGFSQPFGDLGTSLLPELEVGYALPFAQRALSVWASGAYMAPGADDKNLKDDRLPGPASYDLTQQTLMLGLGLSYRLRLPTPLLRPYASLGPRLFLMRTLIKGSAGGEAFGKNDETATQLGLFGALGAELSLGPGAALAELSITWARLNGYVLRDTSAAALALGVGYRLFL